MAAILRAKVSRAISGCIFFFSSPDKTREHPIEKLAVVAAALNRFFSS